MYFDRNEFEASPLYKISDKALKKQAAILCRAGFHILRSSKGVLTASVVTTMRCGYCTIGTPDVVKEFLANEHKITISIRMGDEWDNIYGKFSLGHPHGPGCIDTYVSCIIRNSIRRGDLASAIIRFVDAARRIGQNELYVVHCVRCENKVAYVFGESKACKAGHRFCSHCAVDGKCPVCGEKGNSIFSEIDDWKSFNVLLDGY